MSNKHDEIEDNNNEKKLTVGQQLRLARNEANLTIEYVAEKLYLAVSVITDIESDKNQSNTSIVFVKGYVKSYCVLLNLPVEGMLKCFDQQYQDNNDVKKMQTFSNRTQDTTHNSYLNWVTVLIVLTMIIGVSFWWWQQVDEPIVGVPVNQSNIINNEPSPLLPLTPNLDAATLNIKKNVVESTFTFSGDCWVKVIDATNAVIAVGIKKGGTSIDISGVAPLNVILGAPNMVKINYQGEPLDISSYIVKDTATFTLPLGK